MKVHLVIVSFICIFFSCTNPSKETLAILSPELQQAESIMYQAPDSALRILQGMLVPPASDSLPYATWALFTTQAKYKLFMEQSDSLINIAYPYFLRHGDAQRKALALYYKAVLCKEHNQIEEAQKFCLEAAKEVEKTTDYQLAHLIYVEIADTYAYRGLYDYALIAAQKAYTYAQKSNNIHYKISSLISLARISDKQTQRQKAIEYYKLAIKFAKESKLYSPLSGAVTELIGVYCALQDYDAIKHYTELYINLKNKYNLIMDGSQYAVIGEAYQLLNQSDSAYYYLEKGLEVIPIYTNVYIKRTLYNHLYDIAFDRQDYKKAAIYAHQSLIYNDSVAQIDKSNLLIEMQEKYNQQQLIIEKNELKIKNDLLIRNALIGLLIAMCFIAFLIYIYQKKLQKRDKQIQEAKDEANRKSLQIKENELTISRNQKRMKELMEQIEANKGIQEEWEEQKHILADIRKQNEDLEQKNRDLLKGIQDLTGTLDTQSHDLEQMKTLMEENAYLHEREWGFFYQLMKQDPTLSKLKSTPRAIKEEEWTNIMKAMDSYLDNFTQRLTKAVTSITSNELRLCCLVKLRFATVDIATLLSIEPNSVYRRKTRLKERITQETGNWEPNMTLDLWIWNF